MVSLKCKPESICSRMSKKCLDQNKNTNCFISYNSIVQKKKFNDPILPYNVNKKTTFGIKTKKEFSIGDVIFPNASIEKNVHGSYEDKTELYKISHNSMDTGEQLNRKYTPSFNKDYRYGKTYNRLPAGIWFKNNVAYNSLNENKNVITNFISKILEKNENEHCRYPYIDNRQGKFIGRPYLNVGNIITRSEPDEKEFELLEFLSAINKIKYAVKQKKCNLKSLRETCKLLDKEFTGWLPLEEVYTICYQHQLRPEKKMFNLALNSIHAINNNSVRYDLFTDLLDPDVMFTPSFEKVKKPDCHRFAPTYKNDYENKLSQSIELNTNLGYQQVYTPVKPIVLAHQDCFGYETNVKTLLNPSIFTNYGLTYRDFYIERSKDVIEKLFHDVGASLPSDVFNAIWDNAYQCGGTNEKVSIEMFRQALQDYAIIKMAENHDNIISIEAT